MGRGVSSPVPNGVFEVKLADWNYLNLPKNVQFDDFYCLDFKVLNTKPNVTTKS